MNFYVISKRIRIVNQFQAVFLLVINNLPKIFLKTYYLRYYACDRSSLLNFEIEYDYTMAVLRHDSHDSRFKIIFTIVV